MIRRVLSFETSCDDTSVAIIRDGGFVEAVVSANQDLEHRPFGGVVPEVASRNHTLTILPLVEESFKKAGVGLSDIDGLVVTNRPGLVGSLLVGLVTAKSLALAWGKPFLGVNHLEAHLLAPFLRDDKYEPPRDFRFPFLALAISGGHTHLYKCEELGRYKILGRTLDDAAGEAFDKFGKMLGLGFPGGVAVDKLAREGNPKAYQFPIGLKHQDNLNYSFSGLKTSAMRMIESMSSSEVEKRKADLCASFQEAVVDALLWKLQVAAAQTRLRNVVLTGGVSANSRLRAKAADLAREKNWQLVIPPIRYCTDNAAMVGYAGLVRMQRGEFSTQDLGPSPSYFPGDFIDESRT